MPSLCSYGNPLKTRPSYTVNSGHLSELFHRFLQNWTQKRHVDGQNWTFNNQLLCVARVTATTTSAAVNCVLYGYTTVRNINYKWTISFTLLHLLLLGSCQLKTHQKEVYFFFIYTLKNKLKKINNPTSSSVHTNDYFFTFRLTIAASLREKFALRMQNKLIEHPLNAPLWCLHGFCGELFYQELSSGQRHFY